MQTSDILMVTHQSPERTRLALGALLDSCDEGMRVWLWHNGDHAETLDTVKSFLDHPRVHQFHHSEENVRLWAPTNWLLENAKGDFLSKIDDDNVLPAGWAQKLAKAHDDYDRFGVIGCWRFQPEDFDEQLAKPKLLEYPGGHRLLANLWVEGSCFLMKRQCRDERGLLEPGETFTEYCRSLGLRGWVNGWYYPFIHYENLDDPRAPHTFIKTTEDMLARRPLTAEYNGVETIEQWTDQLRRSARSAQTASIDPRDWSGWRWFLRRAWRFVSVRVRRLFGIKRQW